MQVYHDSKVNSTYFPQIHNCESHLSSNCARIAAIVPDGRPICMVKRQNQLSPFQISTFETSSNSQISMRKESYRIKIDSVSREFNVHPRLLCIGERQSKMRNGGWKSTASCWKSIQKAPVVASSEHHNRLDSGCSRNVLHFLLVCFSCCARINFVCKALILFCSISFSLYRRRISE